MAIQQYLAKHRIGQLFEELMDGILKNTPNDPVPYLIASLEKKKNKRTTMHSTMETEKQTVPSTSDVRKSEPSFSKRAYPKPWQENAKSLQAPSTDWAKLFADDAHLALEGTPIKTAPTTDRPEAELSEPPSSRKIDLQEIVSTEQEEQVVPSFTISSGSNSTLRKKLAAKQREKLLLNEADDAKKELTSSNVNTEQHRLREDVADHSVSAYENPEDLKLLGIKPDPNAVTYVLPETNEPQPKADYQLSICGRCAKIFQPAATAAATAAATTTATTTETNQPPFGQPTETGRNIFGPLSDTSDNDEPTTPRNFQLAPSFLSGRSVHHSVDHSVEFSSFDLARPWIVDEVLDSDAETFR